MRNLRIILWNLPVFCNWLPSYGRHFLVAYTLPPTLRLSQVDTYKLNKVGDP